MRRRIIAFGVALALCAAGSAACGKPNQEKLSLQELLQNSAHDTGVFRYSDQTPDSPFAEGSLVQVRGLIEDDFRFKARLTVDGEDALDEVVNDDALAVRFLDPSFVSKFTSASGGEADVRAALAARFWVTDPAGAPSIGDAALADRVIGVDPIVDALSVVDYASDAVAASVAVQKWNAERLDYRPAEDPFPRPAPGSGVTRWDIVPPPMPKADAVESGQGNASLARAQNFRTMAVYVKDGRVVQIREQIAAKFDLLDTFRNYMIQLAGREDESAGEALEKQLEPIENQPDLVEAVLNFALNETLKAAGEEPVRFRTMVYEFTPSTGVKADLPTGEDVRRGSLAFFGVNSKAAESNNRQVSRQIDSTTAGSTTTTTSASADPSTTSAP